MTEDNIDYLLHRTIKRMKVNAIFLNGKNETLNLNSHALNMNRTDENDTSVSPSAKLFVSDVAECSFGTVASHTGKHRSILQ